MIQGKRRTLLLERLLPLNKKLYFGGANTNRGNTGPFWIGSSTS